MELNNEEAVKRSFTAIGVDEGDRRQGNDDGVLPLSDGQQAMLGGVAGGKPSTTLCFPLLDQRQRLKTSEPPPPTGECTTGDGVRSLTTAVLPCRRRLRGAPGVVSFSSDRGNGTARRFTAIGVDEGDRRQGNDDGVLPLSDGQQAMLGGVAGGKPSTTLCFPLLDQRQRLKTSEPPPPTGECTTGDGVRSLTTAVLPCRRRLRGAPGVVSFSSDRGNGTARRFTAIGVDEGDRRQGNDDGILPLSDGQQAMLGGVAGGKPSTTLCFPLLDQRQRLKTSEPPPPTGECTTGDGVLAASGGRRRFSLLRRSLPFGQAAAAAVDDDGPPIPVASPPFRQKLAVVVSVPDSSSGPLSSSTQRMKATTTWPDKATTPPTVGVAGGMQRST
nr:hypothetical protein Itr_chr05CG11320 [Ipomoea trifida]